MSTIGVDWAKKISSKLQEKQIHFIDAPVTGSTPKAITGELTIFIGAEQDIYERAKPVLESM
jgi:3-hydroxyisobutyrate dehydrogenase